MLKRDLTSATAERQKLLVDNARLREQMTFMREDHKGACRSSNRAMDQADALKREKQGLQRENDKLRLALVNANHRADREAKRCAGGMLSDEDKTKYEKLVKAEEENVCTICMGEDAVKNIAMVPCGHLVCCDDCWEEMPADRRGSCPICRAPAQCSVRLYR